MKKKEEEEKQNTSGDQSLRFAHFSRLWFLCSVSNENGKFYLSLYFDGEKTLIDFK